MIQILLEDDGAGLDLARLREVAVARGLLSSQQATALDPEATIDLIFQPGFSTSPAVTETSGRGVGMDVVRTHVERLNGRVHVSSLPGQGTRFTLSLPLTLATTRAILVEQGGSLFALPSAMIERSWRVQEARIINLEGRRAAQIEDVPVPLVELADVLERPRAEGRQENVDAWRPFVIIRLDERRVGLLVDRLVGEQEIVVKSLGWPLRRVRNVSGAAILGSGQTVAVLNPVDLLKSAWSVLGAAATSRSGASGTPERQRQRILLVDDSLTTRTLERSIVEAAGYDAAVAADGVEALAILRSQQIDLVVSDVTMPHLDGFGLTLEIRQDERLRDIPIVLVTSLDAQEYRERGVAVGADAYLVKARFDQGQLLQTISRLI